MKPDPANPAIANGGFEQLSGDPPVPTGWHYQRQLTVIESKDAPEGGHYVVFRNSTPGRESQARQGFAVDGRKVPVLEFSVPVRAKGVRPDKT